MIKESLDRISAAEAQAKTDYDNAVKQKSERLSFAQIRAQEMIGKAEEDSKANIRMAEVNNSEAEDKLVEQARQEGKAAADSMRSEAVRLEPDAIQAILEYISG